MDEDGIFIWNHDFIRSSELVSADLQFVTPNNNYLLKIFFSFFF